MALSWLFRGGVAQPGRALRSQRRGHGFKSRHLHRKNAPGHLPGAFFVDLSHGSDPLPRFLRPLRRSGGALSRLSAPAAMVLSTCTRRERFGVSPTALYDCPRRADQSRDLAVDIQAPEADLTGLVTNLGRVDAVNEESNTTSELSSCGPVPVETVRRPSSTVLRPSGSGIDWPRPRSPGRRQPRFRWLDLRSGSSLVRAVGSAVPSEPADRLQRGTTTSVVGRLPTRWPPSSASSSEWTTRSAPGRVLVHLDQTEPGPARPIGRHRGSELADSGRDRRAGSLAHVARFPQMIDTDGSSRSELFQPDRLHPNADGCELLAGVLRAELS